MGDAKAKHKRKTSRFSQSDESSQGFRWFTGMVPPGKDPVEGQVRGTDTPARTPTQAACAAPERQGQAVRGPRSGHAVDAGDTAALPRGVSAPRERADGTPGPL